METITVVAVVVTIVAYVLSAITWRQDFERSIELLNTNGWHKCATWFDRSYPLLVSAGGALNVAMIAYLPGTTIGLHTLAIVYMFARQYVKEKYGIEC